MSSQGKLRFTILGCASSPGVPRINGDWGGCDPTNPRNQRTRCSLLVERIGPKGITRLVVDTSPDFRQQMLAAKVDSLDAVLYSHPHADHIHGIDDLRQYALLKRARIPVYSDQATRRELYEKFGYIFKTPKGSMYPPICDWYEIQPGKIREIEGEGGTIAFLPVEQTHGYIHSLGFRFAAIDEETGELTQGGGLAYSSDVSDIPPESVDLLRNLDIWIVDALQYKEHISHFSLAQALDWIRQLKPRQAILTHMHTPLDYETVQRETPDHVEPAYDGMVIELPISNGEKV